MLADQIVMNQLGGTDEFLSSPPSELDRFTGATRDLMTADLNLPKYRSSRLGQVNADGYKNPTKRYPSVLDPDDRYTKAELSNKYDRFPSSLRQSQQRESMRGTASPLTEQPYNAGSLEKSIPVFPYSYLSEEQDRRQACRGAGKTELMPFNKEGFITINGEEAANSPQFGMFLLFIMLVILVYLCYRIHKLTKKVKSVKKLSKECVGECCKQSN